MTTPQYDKKDAIIRTRGSDKGTVDPGLWIVSTLREDWDSSNTNGRAPNVDFAEETKNVTFRGEDWIVLYDQPRTRDSNADINYLHENITIPYQLDIFTSESRRFAYKMWEEIRRVLYAGRKDTFDQIDDDNLLTGRQWLELGNLQFLSTTSSGFYRFTAEVQINWRYRKIE